MQIGKFEFSVYGLIDAMLTVVFMMLALSMPACSFVVGNHMTVVLLLAMLIPGFFLGRWTSRGYNWWFS